MNLKNGNGESIEVSAQEAYKMITKSYASDNAKEIFGNFTQLKAISKQSNRESHVIESHENEFVAPPINTKINRLEEWTCKNMVNEQFDSPDFGKLMGYQIPLKTPKQADKTLNAGLGKIDLLSQKGTVAFILELKVEKSTEHPLRAFLEAYTYWKLVGGEKSSDFLTKSDAKTAKTLEKAIVIYEGSEIHKAIEKEIEKDGEVIQLIRELEVRCFLVKNDPTDSRGITFTYVGEQSL